MKSKALVKVMPPQGTKLAAHVRDVLKMLGENPSREGLARTPERYEKALRFLTSGYDTSLEEIVNNAVFHCKVDEMVIVKDIEFFSMCEHHLLPFFGKVHVAYLPKDKVIGLSKIPRIVNMFARRLQLQERMTQQIAEAVAERDFAARRGRAGGGAAFLHDDAGRGKAAFGHRDQQHAGEFPDAQGDPGRVPVAGAAGRCKGRTC